jgi:tripartite ATP-independent transporter DctM subunit
LWGVWGIVVLILLVMGGIYSGFVAASEAAALGAAGAMIIAVLSGKFNFAKFRDAIFETARTSGMLFLLLIGASIFTSFIAVSGLPDRLVEVIVNTQMSLYGLMIFIVILYIFLGCFLDAMSMMLLTLPVLLPILIQMEVNLIWFGIILCKLMEMGAITPPLGITVYVVKGVVGDKMTLEEIFRGIWWFLAIEFITLLILMVFPKISLFLPTAMLGRG